MSSGDFLNYVLAVGFIILVTLGVLLIIQASLALQFIKALFLSVTTFILGTFSKRR